MIRAFNRFVVSIINMIGTGLCPFGAYWVCHAIVALIIMALGFVISLWCLSPMAAAAVGAAVAAGFYLLREIRDVLSSKARYRAMEGLTRFDWPGLVAPVVAVALVLALVWLSGLLS